MSRIDEIKERQKHRKLNNLDRPRYFNLVADIDYLLSCIEGRGVEGRCDVSVTGKHRVDTPYCKDCGYEFPATTPTAGSERCAERQRPRCAPDDPPRGDDGSECAYGFCPKPRDCFYYCMDHHSKICVFPAPPEAEKEAKMEFARRALDEFEKSPQTHADWYAAASAVIDAFSVPAGQAPRDWCAGHDCAHCTGENCTCPCHSRAQ